MGIGETSDGEDNVETEINFSNKVIKISKEKKGKTAYQKKQETEEKSPKKKCIELKQKKSPGKKIKVVSTIVKKTVKKNLKTKDGKKESSKGKGKKAEYTKVKKVKKKKDDTNESISVKPEKVKKVKLKKKKIEGNESILADPEKIVSSSTPILEKENIGKTETPTNCIEDSILINKSYNIMNSSLTPVKVLSTVKSPKAKGKVEVLPTTRESKSPKASTTPKRPANLKKATDILKIAESNSLFDQKKKSPKKQMDVSEEKDKSKKTKVAKKPVEKTKVEAAKPV